MRGWDNLLERMKRAATRAVIVSEPVRNLPSYSSVVSHLARWASNPGVGQFSGRFDLDELRTLALTHGATDFRYQSGDRNAVAVFRGSDGRSGEAA